MDSTKPENSVCDKRWNIKDDLWVGGRVTRWKNKTKWVKSVGTSEWLAVPNSIQIQIILEHFGGLA